jgi:hypothetical protein
MGCALLRELKLAQRSDPGARYRLEMIGRYSVIGEKGAAVVREICSNLRNAVSRSQTSVFYQRDLLRVLFTAQPLAVLESLCAGGAMEINLGVKISMRRGSYSAWL